MIPRLGRSPGGGNGNPLQYSCLRNHATVHGIAKSQTGLNNRTTTKKTLSHKERILKYGLLKPKKDYPDEVREFLHDKMMKTEKLQDVTRKIFLRQKGEI